MATIKQFKEVTSQMGFYHGLRYIFNCINVKLHGYAMTDDAFHWKSSLYLKKILKRSKYNGEDLKAAKQNVPKNICWILWHSGRENAPAIVKSCLKSIEKNLSGYEIIVLTEKNLFEYVSLPDFLMKKFNSKKITFTQFSDIVRTYLLYFYGGLWLDATILLTADVPEKIKNTPLFLFKSSVVNKPFLPMQSCFIAVKEKGNPLMKASLLGILKYWHTKNIMLDYFQYFIIIKILVESDKNLADIWRHIPYICDSEVHFLQRNLGEKFEQEIFDHMKDISFCHKLTYKLPDSIKKDSGNFYSRVLEENGIAGNSMKIVFLVHSFYVGGAETLATNYLIHLKKSNYDVAVIEGFKVDTFLREKLVAEKIPIFTINKEFGKSAIGRAFRRIYRILFGNRRLNKFIKDFAPDIVHCHTNSFHLDKIKFSPLFYTFHTDVERTFKISDKWFKPSLEKALKNGTHVTALSEKIKEQTLKYFPYADVTVIPNGVDVDFIKTQKYEKSEFLKNLNIPSDAFILGHVGRFHPVKNHEKILDVFEEVHKRNPNSYLLLVGDDANKNNERFELIEKIAQEKNIFKNVIFLGERKDATAVMSVFDCFVFPSHKEGFPLVLCEVQVHNVRCVVSDAITEEAMINDNCIALGVDEPSEKWAECVLGNFENARNKSLDAVDMKNAVARHVDVYKNVLENKK